MQKIRMKSAAGCVAFAMVLAFSAAAALTPTTASAQGPDEARIALLQAKPKAYAIIRRAGTSDDPRLRLAAIEAAQHAPDAALDLARNGLGDENPAVRFGALVTVGKLQLVDLAPAALDLLRDRNESVRAAALFAAKRCGKNVDLSPLGGMLASGSPGTRANAAMLVGQLGDRQAIDMLREMASAPMPRVSPAERSWVRLQFAEAMIRLDPNDAEVLGSIRASIYSNLDDVRVLSIQILGEIRDQSVQGGLAHIVKRDNPIQVKIAAAHALVRFGDTQGIPTLLRAARYSERELRDDLEDYIDDNGVSGPEAQTIRDLLNNETERFRAASEVRAQAAVALGSVRSKEASERLIALLNDPSEVVRVAAASALLSASR
ncbi:MAG: HEAT repeat domain-containing protein [Phycisphaeraceae bacterium]